MSAYIQAKAHIDYLLGAAMSPAILGIGHGPMSWLAPHEAKETDYESGQPWGPTAVETARAARREMTIETAARVGAMLVLENVRSVAFRYGGMIVEVDGIATSNKNDDGRELPGPCDPYYTRPYRFDTRALLRSYDPVEVLVAIAGYEYQACEHPGWKTSEARAFCEALRHAAMRALPGWDEAGTWSVEGSA